MNPWWCHHPETTEPDDEGYAICTKCSAAVVVRLTPAVLERAMEAALRR